VTGSELQITSGTGFTGFPAVQADDEGKFIVVWIDRDGNGSGMSGQRFDSSGSPLGTQFQVNSYTLGSQYNVNHGLFVGPDGDFVVAWTTETLGGLSFPDGVFAQRFRSTGERSGTEFQVGTYTVGTQTFPAVAGHSDGFVIVWLSDTQNNRFDVVGQRYLNGAVCPEAPPAGCFPAGRSALVMKRSQETASVDALAWRWRKDPSVESDVASSASAYVLCLYEGFALASETRISGSCNEESCWNVADGTGRRSARRFTDNRGHGLPTRPREVGLSRILVRGRGTNLALPALPLDEAGPIIVQLHRNDGAACWEATYTSPAPRNDSFEYRNSTP
jgi:hypothetical protein